MSLSACGQKGPLKRPSAHLEPAIRISSFSTQTHLHSPGHQGNSRVHSVLGTNSVGFDFSGVVIWKDLV
ncbi:MAG: lipoprotein [Burkholderiales bacterium]